MSSPVYDTQSDEDKGETELLSNYDSDTDDETLLDKAEMEMGSNYESDVTEGGSLHQDSQSDDKNNNYQNSPSARRNRKTKRLNVNRTYGLRPRTQLRRPSYDCDGEDKDLQQTSSKKEAPKNRVRGTVVAKYRRLTANARERQRMKEINTAFVTLQGVLPVLENRRHPSGSASTRASMTKIRTLRHAASYIQALSDLLSSGIEKEKDIEQSYTASLVTNTSHYQNNTSAPAPHLPNSNCLQSSLSTFANQTNHSVNAINHSQHPTQLHSEAVGPLEENALSWEDVQTTDEELFSLLEKEVLSMRKGPLNEENNPNLGGINWSDDLPPLG